MEAGRPELPGPPMLPSSSPPVTDRSFNATLPGGMADSHLFQGFSPRPRLPRSAGYAGAGLPRVRAPSGRYSTPKASSRGRWWSTRRRRTSAKPRSRLLQGQDPASGRARLRSPPGRRSRRTTTAGCPGARRRRRWRRCRCRAGRGIPRPLRQFQSNPGGSSFQPAIWVRTVTSVASVTGRTTTRPVR